MEDHFSEIQIVNTIKYQCYFYLFILRTHKYQIFKKVMISTGSDCTSHITSPKREPVIYDVTEE